jgi:hypothetical protein
VTGRGVYRSLEWGAKLGFHGFNVSGDKIVLLNESLDVSRVVTGLILEYAQRMKEVDIGWLSRALSSGDLVFTKKPKDIKALSITLKDRPNSVSSNWSENACRKVVNAHMPSLDSSDRIGGSSSAIKSLREELTWARYGSALADRAFDGHPIPNPLASLVVPFISRLSDADALELLLGEPIFDPILESRGVPLLRGAGFYHDGCVAIRSKGDLKVVLTDTVFHTLLVTRFSGQDGMLAMLGDDVDLW